MLPPNNIAEQMLLAPEKPLVRKLPSIRIHFPESIGVELADEAGEVGVLEMRREEEAGEVEGVDDDEAVVGGAPGDEVVGGGVGDHLVCLGDEGGRRQGITGGRRRRAVVHIAFTIIVHRTGLVFTYLHA